MKKALPLFLISAALAFAACKKSDDGTSTTSQTIITSDSSSVSGRLYINIYNSTGTNTVNNAWASLFLSYEDMIHNMPLYSINGGSSGRVDFGYILQGNYYITAYSSDGTFRDSTVAQIIPKRTITRNLYIH